MLKMDVAKCLLFLAFIYLYLHKDIFNRFAMTKEGRNALLWNHSASCFASDLYRPVSHRELLTGYCRLFSLSCYLLQAVQQDLATLTSLLRGHDQSQEQDRKVQDAGKAAVSRLVAACRLV